MTNKLALSIKSKADKMLTNASRFWRDDEKMLKSRTDDYADLVWIAVMIEAEFADKVIQKAIWKLDTIVREEIPQKVFDRYFSEKS